MYARDRASQGLGIRIVDVSPGCATMTMTVRADMLNGHAICHGGFVFLLADSAFAFACNSYNLTTVASGCTIDFLAPSREGDELTARARRAQRRQAHRRLRHRRREPARRDDRALPGEERAHQGQRDRGTDGGLTPAASPRRRRRKHAVEATEARRPRADRAREPRRTAPRCSSSALRWSLRHAYANVPHYRKAFDAKGVTPDDLRTLADLAKFPFTVKTDLRDNYPFGMFAVPRERVSRIHASSGTTGKPTVVGYTAKDIDTWATVMARSIRAAGGARRATSSTSPTATGCSPAGWARTTAPRSSAAR